MDANYIPRIRYITRLEGMVSAGCKFSPNDLDPETWDHLLVLLSERNWMREKVDKQWKTSRDPHPYLSEEGKKALELHRKEQGIPPPGQSLFPMKRKP
jgi:hypothetical protein